MLPDPLPFPEPRAHPLPDVASVLDRLAHAIRQAGLDDVTLTGRLVGWRRTGAWGQGELVASSSDGTHVTARIPLGLPGPVAAAVEARCTRTGTPLTANPIVTVTGAIEVHPRYGPVRVVARTLVLDADATAHNEAARTATIRQLQHGGVLDNQQALTLPTPITRIGVIAGAGTAARADFRARIARRPDPYILHDLDVPTTGPAAPAALAAAIGRLARRDLDCIAILRGGGPAADLAAFDHPDVAIAIGHCNVPVLTGIGHATNRTLADRAAHRALPTPSTVADHVGRHNAAHVLHRAVRDAEQARRATHAAQQDADVERAASAAMRARARILAALCIALVIVVVVAVVV